MSTDPEVGAWWFDCPWCGAEPGQRCDMGMLRQSIYELPGYHSARLDKGNKARRLTKLDVANARDGAGRIGRLDAYLRRTGGRPSPCPDDDPRVALTRRRRLRTAEVKAEIDRVTVIGDEAQPPYGGGGTVYRCYGPSNELIYVGKAYAGLVRSRLRDHARKQWWQLIEIIVLVPFDFYGYVESAEIEAIKNEHPLVNVAHATSKR